MRKLFALLIGLFLFIVVQKASAATLSVNPTSGNLNANETMTVQIMLDTQGQQIDGVDVFSLNFNPSLLQVDDVNPSQSGVQIGAGSLMPITVVNTVLSSSGKIQFSQTSSGGTKFNGNGVLATVTFRGLAGGTSSINFDYTSGSTADSNVASNGVDLLSGVTNGSVIVNGPPPTNPPPGSTPTVRPDHYPSGTIFKYANNPTVYIKEGEAARPITDFTVYQNQIPPGRHIITIPSSVTFPAGSVVGLRSGTLIRASNNATVYLVVAGQKRPFASETEFRNAAYRFDQVYTINDVNLVNAIPTTTGEFVRPSGTLFKYANDATVYFLNGSRQKIGFTTIEMFRIWAATLRDVITVPDSETYPSGTPTPFPNGILVKGTSATVYFTFNGTLRPFSNQTLFDAMGLRFDQVHTFTNPDINMHGVGNPME